MITVSDPYLKISNRIIIPDKGLTENICNNFGLSIGNLPTYGIPTDTYGYLRYDRKTFNPNYI